MTTRRGTRRSHPTARTLPPAVRTPLALCLVAAACSAAPRTPAAVPTADVPATDVPSVADVPPAVDVPTVPPAADLSPVLEPIRDRYALPALAAAVYDADHALAAGAVGLRAADQPDVAVTVDDRWHLGSDTKAMTATLLARLVERGTLRWDTTLAEAFPDDAPAMRAEYRAVTLEQLLQHRGGLLGNLLSRPALWNPLRANARPLVELRRAFVAQVLALAPEVPVGTYLYSNAGYMVVGAAIERATNRPWEDLMRDEVFAPLEMSSCGFGAPATVDTTDAPWGHVTTNGENSPVPPGPGADNPAALGPAGTVHCTLRDRGLLRPAPLPRRHPTNNAVPPPRELRPHAHATPARRLRARLGRRSSHVGRQSPGAHARGEQHDVPVLGVDRAVAGRVLLVATNAADTRASEAVEATLVSMVEQWVPRE